MNLYNFTVTLNTDKSYPVVVCAESDEQAFLLAEIEMEKEFLKLPVIKEIVLTERKKVLQKGVAFVITEEKR
ncbi:MAG: DUF3906 family protein [Bacillaceae bacterium]|nr:DUF3906 family protein [Bacillaceae bacterium]